MIKYNDLRDKRLADPESLNKLFDQFDDFLNSQFEGKKIKWNRSFINKLQSGILTVLSEWNYIFYASTFEYKIITNHVTACVKMDIHYHYMYIHPMVNKIVYFYEKKERDDKI